MADNITLATHGGTIVIGADDISSVYYQRVKLIFGGDGTNSGDVSSTNPLPAKELRPGAAAVTSVNDTASSTTLLASNSARLGATFFNESTSTLYLKCGATASVSSYTVQIGPNGYWELPQPAYTGVIDGIWSADASGAVRITEFTLS